MSVTFFDPIFNGRSSSRSMHHTLKHQDTRIMHASGPGTRITDMRIIHLCIIHTSGTEIMDMCIIHSCIIHASRSGNEDHRYHTYAHHTYMHQGQETGFIDICIIHSHQGQGSYAMHVYIVHLSILSMFQKRLRQSEFDSVILFVLKLGSLANKIIGVFDVSSSSFKSAISFLI